MDQFLMIDFEVVPDDDGTLVIEQDDQSIEARFMRFHRYNPAVYAELVRMARQAKDRGLKHIGIKHLVEVVRWNQMMTRGDADFKINNSYSSRYARLIQTQEPDIAEMFRTRELKSA